MVKKMHLGVKKAELELSVLSMQCLSRRIGSMEKLECEVKAWVKERNAACEGCLAVWYCERSREICETVSSN